MPDSTSSPTKRPLVKPAPAHSRKKATEGTLENVGTAKGPTPRQRAYVAGVLAGKSKRRAALDAGYTESSARKEGRDLSTIIGDQRASFSLDRVRAEKQLERERRGYAFQARDPKDHMRLSLVDWRSSRDECRSWQDSGDDRLENHLREIAVELIVGGEQAYRDSAVHHREWRIQRKAELEEQERKRKTEEERKRRERQAKLEQACVDHLLGQAAAMHRAEQIRAYVAAVCEANKTAPDAMSDEELNSWAGWALAQADRIDPIVSGLYKTGPPEPEE